MRSTVHLFLRLLLAWCVAFAPTLPAFASAGSGAEEHGTHAAHAEDHAHAAADTDSPSSGVHENCDDHCCLACTMHFLSVVAPAGESFYARSIQTPVVHHLHSRAAVAPPDRPPRISA